MAITRYVGDRFSGLSGDSKPTDVISGAEFIETDTGAIFVYDGTSWVVAPSVSNLGDTNLGTLSSGDFLSYDGSNWVNSQLVLADISDIGDLALPDLDDVTITTAEPADVLRYDGTEWVNAALAASDIQSGTFADGRIAESNVTQHEGALSITLSQVTDSGAAAALGVTGADALVVTGTSGTSGNLLEWNGDGDAVDSGLATSNVLTDITGEDIGDLNDVAIGTVSGDQVLSYNSGTGQWENVDLSTIISDVSALNDLSDVTITTAEPADVLRYDGAEWVNAALAASDIQSDTFADGRIAQSNVTQHEGALSITLSQVTDSGAAAALGVTGADALVVTGTSGTSGNLLEWNGDGDAVDSSLATSDVLTAVETDSTINGDGTAGNVLSVNTTEIQQTSEKGLAGGYVGLNGNAKIDSGFLPALAITEVFVVADIPARDALVIGTGDGEVQEGDVAVVQDAGDDPNVVSGQGASYIWDGTAWTSLSTPDTNAVAAGADTQIQFNESGDFAADANFTFTRSNDRLDINGNLQITENTTAGSEPITPANDAAVYFVETTQTETFVKVRLGNGDDAIVASYVQA